MQPAVFGLAACLLPPALHGAVEERSGAASLRDGGHGRDKVEGLLGVKRRHVKGSS